VYGTDEDAAGYQKMTQLLCRLIAADDKCRHVAVGYHKLADEDEDDDEDFETTDLPLDVEALETLVTQVGSERGFSISDDFFLWGEHEDVLLLNGHGNIRLWIGVHIADELVAALNEQRSPSKLSLAALWQLPGRFLDPVVDAISANTTTTDLRLGFECLGASATDKILRAVEANRGLRVFKVGEVSAEQWPRIWASLSDHPTIQEVDFCGLGSQGDESTFTCCIADAVRTNTVLTRLRYDPDDVDATIMKASVIPYLELNRFRPAIAAFHHVGSDQVRARLLLPALSRMSHNPMVVFRILREHAQTVAAAAMTGRTAAASAASHQRPGEAGRGVHAAGSSQKKRKRAKSAQKQRKRVGRAG
jgi:hypothetical protein